MTVGKRGHDVAPGVPRLRPAGYKQYRWTVTAFDIMDFDAVGPGIAMREALAEHCGIKVRHKRIE
jgi:hypothetical protein